VNHPIIFSGIQTHPFAVPTPVVGPLSLSTTEATYHDSEAPDGLSAGVWVCSPGIWRRQMMRREFSRFVVGHCFFTPDNGTTIEIRAGDVVLFPEKCMGTWDVRRTVRKSFVILQTS